MDAHLPEWLWPIALLGGSGAFIDFLIGRAGQDRARSFLETWWIKFDDVHWKNFGQKEALFAVSLLDRWCGRRLFSVRRLIFVTLFFVIAGLIGYAMAIFNRLGNITLSQRIYDISILFDYRFNLMITVVSVVGFAASLSFTRIISIIAAKLMSRGGWKNNILFFTTLMTITYMMVVTWFPITQAIDALIFPFMYVSFDRSSLISLLNIGKLYHDPETSSEFPELMEMVSFFFDRSALTSFSPSSLINRIQNEFRSFHSEDPELAARLIHISALKFVRLSAGYATYLTRIAIAIVFVGSFLVQPFLMRPILLLWRRVVESDKPIFTLMLGGISSGAVAVSELAKHL
jgi:hypothetical protein